MVLDFSKGRTLHLCHVIACILWIISKVWHVSLIWQSDPVCSLPGSLASPISFPLVWTGWNPLATVRPGLDSPLCPLLAVSLQSGYTSVLRVSFLIYKMGLLKVRSGVVMGLNQGEVYWILTLPCTEAGTPFPAGTSLVGRRGTACCASLHMFYRSRGRGRTGGCPYQCSSPQGSPAHR